MRTASSVSQPTRCSGLESRFERVGPSTARLVLSLLLLTGAGCETSGDSTSLWETSGRAAETHLRNVILITMDTTRADALGAYGQVLPASPGIDRMASEGLRFAHVVTSSPSTLPSHASILTGKHPYAHGARSNVGYVLVESNVTLAEALHEQGYRTAAEIAAPVISRLTRLNQGFESYRDTKSPGVTSKAVRMVAEGEETLLHLEERMAEGITSGGIKFLESHQNEKFFLWLHYFDPHEMHAPPDEFRARLPENLYHAEILAVDHEIGRLLDAVRSLGLKQNTLVVLTADHGESLKEHGEPNHTFFVYNSTMRVPLILWGPTILGEGSVVESLVRTVDVAPTVLDLLGFPPLANTQGVSLAPLITGESSDLHLTGYGEAIDLMMFGASPIRFVREGDWKYFHKVNPELYNLSIDPGELDNVAAQNPQIVERLRSRLGALFAEAPSRARGGEVPVDAATREQLQALGYLAADPPSDLEDTMASLELVGVDPVDAMDDVKRLSRAKGAFKNLEFDVSAENYLFLWEKYNRASFGLNAMESLIRLRRFQEITDRLDEFLAASQSDYTKLTQLAEFLLMSGRLDDARKLLQTALEVERCFTNARVRAAQLAFYHQRYEEQLEILRIGAEECAGSPQLRTYFAYALATSPAADQRDGQRALKFALEVLEGDAPPSAVQLDTLAAAYAEVGDFEQAVAYSKNSIALEAKRRRPSKLAKYQKHLAIFEARQPLRDP